VPVPFLQLELHAPRASTQRRPAAQRALIVEV